MQDCEFDDFLKTQRTEIVLPASFKSGVWYRFESEMLAGSPTANDFRSFTEKFGKPFGAAAGIAATVAIGLWLGMNTTPGPRYGKVDYATSITPFAHSGHK